MTDSSLVAAARLSIAALIGLAVGLEREWSGHTSGADARFAGLRTFFLLGVLGGCSGLLVIHGFELFGAAFAAGGCALAVGAYVTASTRTGATPDGTTEAAALAVLALAALAGMGWLSLAAGAGSVMVLVLSEKNRLHALVHHLGERELHAALQFAVLAVAILPVLPVGPLFGTLELRPRMLWIVVLVFSALNFAGDVARRAAGSERGYAITGALGGIVSSTAVTLGFARRSRTEPALGGPLARGVVAACTVLVPRVLVLSALLNPAVARALAPRLLPVFAVGAAIVLFAWRTDGTAGAGTASDPVPSYSLRLSSALQMAVAFQLAITIVAVVRSSFGAPGLYTSAAVLGLTDVDALTVSISTSGDAAFPDVAARALAIGVLANTTLKFTLAAVVGRGRFRGAGTLGLASLAVASLVGLLLY